MDFNVLISAAQGHLRTRNMSVADMKIYTKRNKEKGREKDRDRGRDRDTDTDRQTENDKRREASERTNSRRESVTQTTP